jgi:hypothetical protein
LDATEMFGNLFSDPKYQSIDENIKASKSEKQKRGREIGYS